MTNLIFKRASVRKYTNQPVTKEQIETLLRAGMAAPTAHNIQPWEFIVVENKETLLKIPEFHPYSSMLKEAALAIIVCADINKETPDLKGLNVWAQDCSAATQNILLQAADMGLGSVWLVAFPVKQIIKPLAELLKVPSNIMPFSIISIGYPAEEIKPKDKFNKAKIHYEVWKR